MRKAERIYSHRQYMATLLRVLMAIEKPKAHKMPHYWDVFNAIHHVLLHMHARTIEAKVMQVAYEYPIAKDMDEEEVINRFVRLKAAKWKERLLWDSTFHGK